LRLVTRRELWAADAVDSQGVPIRSKEAAGALREYFDLQLASHDKDFALGVAAELDELNRTGETTPKDFAIVRAVLLDPGILKVGFIALPSLRAGLAGVARRVVDDPQAAEGLTIEAVAVLRMVSKSDFLTGIPAIFRTHGSNEHVAAEALLAILSLVRRDYQQTSTALARPRETLQDVVEYCRGDLAVSTEVARSASAILFETEFRIASSDLPPLTSATACKRLLQLFAEEVVRHHGVGSKGYRVFQAVNGLRVATALTTGRALRSEHWTRAASDWKVCRQYIVHQVLPLLNHVWEALALPTGTGSVDLLPADITQLERLVVPESAFPVGELDEVLAALEALPELMLTTAMADARSAFDWWYEVFLRSPAGQDPARLFKALDACHCDLSLALAELADHAKVADGAVRLRIENATQDATVFCRRPLLQDVLEELVSNADRHPARSGVPEIVVEVGPLADSKIQIRAWFFGTDPTQGVVAGRGRGLTDARSLLAAFDGQMVWGVPEDLNTRLPPAASFGVVIDLFDWGAL